LVEELKFKRILISLALNNAARGIVNSNYNFKEIICFAGREFQMTVMVLNELTTKNEKNKPLVLCNLLEDLIFLCTGLSRTPRNALKRGSL
jgi:hypothetical protein